MKTRFTNGELGDISFADTSLLSISWVNNESDLQLALFWLPPERMAADLGSAARRCTLACVWAFDVQIDFDFGSARGAPLAWASEFSQAEGGCWQVKLDYRGQPDGSLSLKCNTLMFDIGGPAD